MNGAAKPEVEKHHGAVMLVDGDRGPGQVAGVFATDLSIELAREHGAGVVFVHRSSHYGAAGYYAIRAAEAGMVGLSTTNSEPFVVPYGGVDHALGTNPIAIAAPTPDGIWDTDMATSQVAVNKIFNARDEGRTIPEGWGVDEQGRTTTDPERGLRGRAARRLQGLRAGGAGRGALRRASARASDTASAASTRTASRRTSGTSTSPSTSTGWRAASAGRAARPPARRPQGDPARARPRRGAGAGRAGGARQAERERDGIPLPPTLWTALNELSAELGVTPPAAG